MLAFDLSTHTGWAYYENGTLTRCGSFDVKIYDYVTNVKSYKDLPDVYPGNLLCAANWVLSECIKVWDSVGAPRYIVTEHTEGSKHRISQRTLEFIHYAFFTHFFEYTPYVKYLLNSDWRRHTHCYISQWPEMQKFNKEVAKAKRKATPNKAGAKVAKIDGKIVSKWDAKKLSIYIAKQNHPDFAGQITNDNIADAINLGDTAIAVKLFEGCE